MNDFLTGTITPRDWAFTLGIFGVAAVIVAAFYIFIHQPKREELAGILKNDEILVSDLEKARTIAATIEELRDKMRAIESLVVQFEERLPSQHEIPKLLIVFENMAAEENLEVELTSLSRSRDSRKETIPYRVITTGTFHEIIAFINQLERFKRYLKITNLEIKPIKDSRTTASFTLNTYRFIKPDESKKSAA